MGEENQSINFQQRMISIENVVDAWLYFVQSLSENKTSHALVLDRQDFAKMTSDFTKLLNNLTRRVAIRERPGSQLKAKLNYASKLAEDLALDIPRNQPPPGSPDE
jgi:hypothetical protein